MRSPNEENIPLHDIWIPLSMLPLVCLDGADIYRVISDSSNDALHKAIFQILNLSACNNKPTCDDVTMLSSQNFVAMLMSTLVGNSPYAVDNVSAVNSMIEEVERNMSRSDKIPLYSLVLQRHLCTFIRGWCQQHGLTRRVDFSSWLCKACAQVHSLAHNGSKAQKEKWLKNLLSSAVRSSSLKTVQLVINWGSYRGLITANAYHHAAIVAASKGDVDVWRFILTSWKHLENAIVTADTDWCCLQAVISGCETEQAAMLNGGIPFQLSRYVEWRSRKIIAEECLTKELLRSCSTTAIFESREGALNLLDLSSSQGFWSVTLSLVRSGVGHLTTPFSTSFLHRALLVGRFEIIGMNRIEYFIFYSSPHAHTTAR